MNKNLGNVSRDGNVREITFRTSRFVAIVDKRINQSLHGRSEIEDVVQRRQTDGACIRTVKPRDTWTVETIHWKMTTDSMIHGVLPFFLRRR